MPFAVYQQYNYIVKINGHKKVKIAIKILVQFFTKVTSLSFKKNMSCVYPFPSNKHFFHKEKICC